MPPKGSYKMYYDINSKQKIPRSTMYKWRKKYKKYSQLKQRVFNGTDFVNRQPSSTANTANYSKTSMEDNAILYESMHIPLDEVSSAPTIEVIQASISENITTNNDAKENKKLQSKCCNCTDMNVAEVLLLFLTVGKKHSLTWIALLDIFEILNYVFKKKLFPVTKYTLKKLLGVNNETFTNHVTCDKCNKYIGESTNSNFRMTCTCGTKINSSSVGSFFIQINPIQQLRKLFEDPIIHTTLEERFDRNKTNPNALEDIYDGKKYKDYCKDYTLLGNPYNFSYTFNTDGCQASDNSRVTIWPIYFMIHELPDYLRKKCMPLVGLWVAKREPDMKVFLQPFVDNANQLSSKGFSWTFCGKEIISKLFPLGCCVDSPARCSMLNMKRFNGIYGCTYCEHPTELIEHVRKYPMMSDPPSLRTHDSIIQHMVAAYEGGTSDVMGVWGPSPLMYLKYFNLVEGMVIDFMHSCLLGVTELHLSILMTNTNEEYYIGSPAHVQLINETLLSIKPPSSIPQIPRNIEEKNQWKASQWLSWLIYYSLVCLEGVLPRKYYDHWTLFVAAMNILLEDSITSKMLQEAGILLVKFVYYFEKLYGKQYMHYNVHLLLHLKDTVKQWGPLWANNTFAFENQNRLLLKKKNVTIVLRNKLFIDY